MDDVKIIGTIIPRAKGEPSVLSGGLLKVLPADSDYATLLTNKLKNYGGEKLEITFRDPESWSNRANRLFHALIRKIVHSGQTDYWGLMGKAPESFDEVKDWAKVEMGEAEVKTVGRWMHIQSWTEFSKKKACNTIDNMLDWMVNKGIDIDAEKLEGNSLRGVIK